MTNLEPAFATKTGCVRFASFLGQHGGKMPLPFEANVSIDNDPFRSTDSNSRKHFDPLAHFLRYGVVVKFSS